MMYAELIGNYEKQRIKSFCDNKFAYVEYGHRTADHRGWVKGHFMLAISEQELENIAPKVLERKIKKYLEGYLK